MATGQKPRKPGSDIPDLAAPRAAPARPNSPEPARPKTPPASLRSGPQSSPQDYFGSSNFDFEGLEESGGSALAIETEGEAPAAFGDPAESDSADFDGLGASAEADEFESTGQSTSKVQFSKPPQSPRDPWPTGETPDSAAIVLDPHEVALVADYGTAPAGIPLAPLYAIRVLSRRRPLKSRIAELTEGLRDAERRRDEEVRRMAESLRESLATTEQGAAIYAGVAETEGLAEGRKKNLAGVNVAFESEASAIDAELEDLRREIEHKTAALDAAERVLDERRRGFDRAEARKKRLFIELRGLVDVAEKSGGTPTDDQARRIDDLEAKIAAQKPELDAALAAKKDAEAGVAAARSELDELERAGRDAERRRGGVARVYQKQIGAREKGVDAAESSRGRALVDAGRKILAARGRLGDVSKAVLSSLLLADAACTERATELEKYVRAIDSYDKPSFRRGLAVGGGALFVLLLVLLYGAFGSSAPKGPNAEPPAAASAG